MKIYAPVKDFNGLRNNVRFVNGVGETDDPRLVDWFADHGYKVDRVETNLVNPLQSDQIEAINNEVEMMGYSTKFPDFEEMSPNEIRNWAKANGFGGKIKNIRSKEKLLEIIRGE